MQGCEWLCIGRHPLLPGVLEKKRQKHETNKEDKCLKMSDDLTEDVSQSILGWIFHSPAIKCFSCWLSESWKQTLGGLSFSPPVYGQKDDSSPNDIGGIFPQLW